MACDENEVFAYLVKEGLLEQKPDGLQITYKGRMVIHQGGFKKLHHRETFTFVCTIIAAAAGVLAIVLQIIFFLLK